MLKISLGVLMGCLLIAYSVAGFAINPGAAQAQIRNNQAAMESNKQFKKEVQKHQQKLKQQKVNSQPVQQYRPY